MDLLGGLTMEFTPEQSAAIERRDGDLLLDAGAGSGKTRVLTERFARSVEDDGVAIGEMLTITFTDKAAAELRERIRLRLAQGPRPELARETESAWISTIHGFCSRILRAHALQAGIDPQFSVLDQAAAEELATAACAAATTEIAVDPEGAKLIAAYNIAPLQTAVRDVYDELRSRGEPEPRLPPVFAADEAGGREAVVAAASERFGIAAEALRLHMLQAAVTKSVAATLEMLTDVGARIDVGFECRRSLTRSRSRAREKPSRPTSARAIRRRTSSSNRYSPTSPRCP